MNTPLHRLYRTRLALVAVLLMVGGVVLLVAAQWITEAASWWPWLAGSTSEAGSAILIAGLITILLEYVNREDAEERAMYRLREVFKEQAPALRDSMLETFATDADTLKKVASEQTLDGIARNSLAIQLRDVQLANDMYDDLREQVVRVSERWRGVHVSVSLAPWSPGPASGQGSMFEATIRWEYRVTLPSAVQRFSCVSDLDEYRQALHDPTSTLVWYFEPIGTLTATSPEAFELLEFTVDGKKRTIRRGRRAKSQAFTVDTMAAGPGEVVVAYTYRVLVQRHSHLLQLDIAKPTKGLKVQFVYSDCGIRHVNVIDAIASSKQPRIGRAPSGASRSVIEVAFDGWVWPKSGVGFVWVLEEEINKKIDRNRRLPLPSGKANNRNS